MLCFKNPKNILKNFEKFGSSWNLSVWVLKTCFLCIFVKIEINVIINIY